MILSQKENQTCVICLETGMQLWTHRGGEKHDGFHRECLDRLYQYRFVKCPLCKQEITLQPSRKAQVLLALQSVKRSLLVAAQTGICMGIAAYSFLMPADGSPIDVRRSSHQVEQLSPAASMFSTLVQGTCDALCMIVERTCIAGVAVCDRFEVLRDLGYSSVDTQNIFVGLCLGLAAHYEYAPVDAFWIGMVSAGGLSFIRSFP